MLLNVPFWGRSAAEFKKRWIGEQGIVGKAVGGSRCAREQAAGGQRWGEAENGRADTSIWARDSGAHGGGLAAGGAGTWRTKGREARVWLLMLHCCLIHHSTGREEFKTTFHQFDSMHVKL